MAIEDGGEDHSTQLVVGARVKLPAPGLPTDDLYSATVTLRAPPKGEDSDERGTVMIVYDDSSLDPQWCKQVLSEEFCCAFNADNHFISAATDVSVSHQAAGVFMARSQKKAEGVFYGLTSVPGFDGKLTLPSLYWSVADPSSDTSAMRYPTSLKAGSYVLFYSKRYVLVRFIIHTELQQVRYYALLGDEAALQPSPVLIPRYFVNPLCQAREALLHSVEPPHSCPA